MYKIPTRLMKPLVVSAIFVILLFALMPSVIPATSAYQSSSPSSVVYTGAFAGWGVQNKHLGSITGITAYWIQPVVKCDSSSHATQGVNFGLGLYNATPPNNPYKIHASEETAAICKKGSDTPVYEALYTILPNSARLISSITVHPDDAFAGSIFLSSGNVTFKLEDVTTNQTFTASEKATGLDPSLTACSATYVNMLSPGGPPRFQRAIITCYPTIDGKTQPIGMFTSAPNVLYKFVNTHHGVVDIVPSGLSSDKARFVFMWKSSG